MIIKIIDSKINTVLKTNASSSEHVEFVVSKSFLWLAQHGTKWVKSPGHASRIINENNN